MKKIIIVVLLLALSPVAYASHESLVQHAFCSQKINDIDIAASNIKSDELARQLLLKDSINAGKEKNYSKTAELNKYIKEYDDKIAVEIHLLADIVSIYKAADCDMSEAIQVMYCPTNWSKDCEWVYITDQKKSKVKSNP